MGEVSAVGLLILILATWRITSLVTEEDGPWFVFERFRYKAGIRDDKEYPGLRYGRNEFARGLLCFYCSSLWVGILLVITYWFVPVLAIVMMLPFALSAGAILMRRR